MSEIIVFSIAVTMLLAGGIIFFVVLYQHRVINHQQEVKEIEEHKQQDLMNASIESEERERERIASELHDDLGATLSSVRLYLYSAEQTADNKAAIHQSKLLLDDSIQKVRNISHQLQPGIIEQLGLQAALSSFANTINKAGKVSMVYQSEVLPKLLPNTELALYRMVQELVTNILKHADAAAILLTVDTKHSNLEVMVQHDGLGLTEEDFQKLVYKQEGLGLKNILARAKSINATLSFNKTENNRYQVFINAPL